MQTEPDSIDNTADVIDSRDIIARIEWLEGETNRDEMASTSEADPELVEELAALTDFMDEIRGTGGDEQWRGDWYPAGIIRDSYFEDYAQELAEDIGAIPDNAQWPCTCIDWAQAARELRMDYTGVEFDGVTYWVR